MIQDGAGRTVCYVKNGPYNNDGEYYDRYDSHNKC